MEQLRKNQTHDCEIEGWAHDGAGVARVMGRAVFVPGAIPGERWRVRVVKATNSAVYGRGEACLDPSSDRTEPDCPVFARCGGCALRHMTYEAELRFKLERVNEAYRRIGGLSLRAETIFGAETLSPCRNKAIYAVTGDLRPGFYRPRSHDVTPVERCLLQTPASDRAAWTVCDFAREHGFSAYDEAAGRGLLRHIFTRTARSTGEMQVVIVAAGGFKDKTRGLIEAIRKNCPTASGIILNVNKSPGNTVLAGDFHTLWGSDTLTDTLCGNRFALSPESFYQINPEQAERLYGLAAEFAGEGGIMLDLYCGAGTITLCLARRAERVTGVESVPAAVANAREGALANGVHNVEFLCADAAGAAEELLRRGAAPRAVVLDPPRRGLAPEAVDAVCALSPERVVYVSCDVSTQARDLRRFSERGYAPVRAAAVDMFPRTAHVETCVRLEKKPE